MDVLLNMIKYRSERPTEIPGIACRRIFLSINPVSLSLFGLYCIIGALVSDLFGILVREALMWILVFSLSLTIGHITLIYRTKVLPFLEKVRINISKNGRPNLQEDVYNEEGIKHNVYGESHEYSYSKIKGIYFFSDVIIVYKKREVIFYYDRNSFINTTEEEWVQFMKSKNPKIKVRRFKSDYIWYF